MDPKKSDLHIDLDPNASDTNFGRKIIERAQQRIEDESLERLQPRPTESRAYQNLIGSPGKMKNEAVESKATDIVRKAYREFQSHTKTDDESAEKQPEVKKAKASVKKAKASVKKPSKVTQFNKPLNERMEKGIATLKGIGFEDVAETKTVTKVEEKEAAEEIPSAKEVFETTYDKFQGSLIDGKNLPISMEEEHREKEKEPEEEKSFYRLRKSYQKEKESEEESEETGKSKIVERPKPGILKRIFTSPFRSKSIEKTKESKELEGEKSTVIPPTDIEREEPELLPDLPTRISVEDLRDPQLEPGEKIALGDVGFVEVVLEANFPDLKERVKDRSTRHTRAKEEKNKKEVKRLDINLKAYFEDPDKVLGPETDMAAHIKKLISKTRLDQEPEEGFLIDLNPEGVEATYSPTKKSGWSPGSLENLLQKKENEKEGEPAFTVKTRSWLGTYIVGTDYWQKKDGHDLLLQEKIGFDMDEERPWYDLALSLFASVGKKSKEAEHIATLSREMMDNLKENIPDSNVGAVTSSGIDRVDTTTFLHPDWNEELLSLFHRFSRLDEATTVKSKLSLTNIDKWLESVGLLDFSSLTLINTGLCYKLAGGQRYGGLGYPEFKYFLDLIARSVNRPFSDVVSQLFAAYGEDDIIPENMVNN